MYNGQSTFFTTINSLWFKIIILATSGLIFLLHGTSSGINKLKESAEGYAVMLLALIGALVMVNFDNFITLFVAIELLSIALYILVGIYKDKTTSSEASLKYFLSGAIFSAILLLGMIFLYGASGSLDILEIKTIIINKFHGIDVANHVVDNDLLLYLGLVLILVALSFKLGLAPFHFWLPDVYEGAPLIVTLFMSTVVKVAVISVWLQIFEFLFYSYINFWVTLIISLILISVVISNLFALSQTKIKRLMAFSSISHSAFFVIMLISMCVRAAQSTIIFYLIAYIAATIITLTISGILTDRNGPVQINSFNGLIKTKPYLTVLMSIALLSLAGIPLTMGFIAKLHIFLEIVKISYPIVVILIILSILGIYYYFKIIIAMCFINSDIIQNVTTLKNDINLIQTLVLSSLAAIILLLGIYPSIVFQLIDQLYP
ncbi:MAG: NADH-quinone oxidoreductase subunit N [Solitalea-like symbiont of Acarus siro]